MIERLAQTRVEGMAPTEELARELEVLQGLSPEAVAAYPKAALFAADGLATVRMRFGVGEEVRAYTGSWETEPVPAFYHCYDHTFDGIRNFVDHARLASYSPRDMMRGIAVFAHHDRFLGNGRFTENPESYDERTACQEAERILLTMHLGRTTLHHQTCAGIPATRFNPDVFAQDVDKSRGHITAQKDASDNDFSAFDTTKAGRDTMRVVAEDGFKRANGGWLRKLAIVGGVGLTSTFDAMRLVDNAGTDDTICKVAKGMRASAKLMRTHTFLGDRKTANPRQRAENIAQLNAFADRIETRAMTCVEAYGILRSLAATAYDAGDN